MRRKPAAFRTKEIPNSARGGDMKLAEGGGKCFRLKDPYGE